jgi:hypothetical protein
MALARLNVAFGGRAKQQRMTDKGYCANYGSSLINALNMAWLKLAECSIPKCAGRMGGVIKSI